MPKRIHVEPHLTEGELIQLWRSTKEPVKKQHLQVVLLALRGRFSTEIRAETGYDRTWVFEIMRRYNGEGPDGLGDRRGNNGGHGRILDDEQLAELAATIGQPHPDGGPWTSTKVAAWMTERSGRSVDIKLAWSYLQRLGWTVKTPRPRHVDTDVEAQEAFKKGGSEIESWICTGVTPV